MNTILYVYYNRIYLFVGFLFFSFLFVGSWRFLQLFVFLFVLLFIVFRFVFFVVFMSYVTSPTTYRTRITQTYLPKVVYSHHSK